MIILKRIEEAEKRDHRKLRKRNGPYFTLERKVQDPYFGMREDGVLFQKLIDYMRLADKESCWL